MPTKVELLIIHVPKFRSHYKPYGEFMTVNLIPMGTWALADLVEQAGFRVKILHLGIEWLQTGQFSPAQFLQKSPADVVAIPLHWHQQAYHVVQAAEQVKQVCPEAFVLSGGYTASFFHRELLSFSRHFDGIIRGDAEKPLPALLQALTSRSDRHDIPNLTWRCGDTIIENPLTYTASEGDLDRSSYANTALLEQNRLYQKYFGIPFVWSKGLTPDQNRKHFHFGPSLFPLNIGRGCTGNCTWCGGGAKAQRLVNGRRGVVFRDPQKVADTAREALSGGYEMLHIAFDPGKEGERYFRTLFPIFRRRNIRPACYFESFSLPSETLMTEFAATFDRKNSIVAISPESGNESVRNRNRSFTYSNEDLLKAISTAEKSGIWVDLFFSMGIPFETRADLDTTAALRNKIRKRFKNIRRMWTSPIGMEPASPWYMDPEAFGVVLTRRTFADYYRDSSPEGKGIGYFIPEYGDDDHHLDSSGFAHLLRGEKCRRHCSYHPNPRKSSHPFMGRIYCRYMQLKTGGARG